VGCSRTARPIGSPGHLNPNIWRTYMQTADFRVDFKHVLRDLSQLDIESDEILLGEEWQLLVGAKASPRYDETMLATPRGVIRRAPGPDEWPRPRARHAWHMAQVKGGWAPSLHPAPLAPRTQGNLARRGQDGPARDRHHPHRARAPAHALLADRLLPHGERRARTHVGAHVPGRGLLARGRPQAGRRGLRRSQRRGRDRAGV
jgi:hypothetical protein